MKGSSKFGGAVALEPEPAARTPMLRRIANLVSLRLTERRDSDHPGSLDAPEGKEVGHRQEVSRSVIP
jgi:hypothetical protein